MAARAAVENAETYESVCWCCGAIDHPNRMIRLGNHPEVTLCIRCGRWAAKQAWAIEDRGRSGPLVQARDAFRRLRRGVIRRGWHRSRVWGGPLRWIGKRLP